MRRRTVLAVGSLVAGVALTVVGLRPGSTGAAGTAAAVAAAVVLVVAVSYAVDRGLADGDHWQPAAQESGHRVPVPQAEEPEEEGTADDDGDRGLLRGLSWRWILWGSDRRGGESGGSDRSGGEPWGSGAVEENADDAGESTDGPTVRTHVTNRWTGVAGVGLALAVAGVVARTPGLVLAGAVGVAFAGYVGVSEPPGVVDPETGDPVVTVERSVDAASLDPGEAVTVTVTVRNTTDRVLSDVRVVDGVPPALSVTTGSPRHGAVLGPADETEFSYTVTARRGEHDWDPAEVVLAGPSGAVERELRVDVATTLRCRPPALDTDRLPLRGAGTQYAGQVETDEGGAGIEFHSTREYRPGDPLSRIDWYRRAETGEFATLAFREERAAKVMLLVDSRRAAYRAPTPDGTHAVQRSVDAAGRTFTALLDTGDRVGIAALGRAVDDCWLPPGAGDDHRAAGRELLTSHPALSPVLPARDFYAAFRDDRRETLERRLIAHVHQRLSPTAQVLFFTPCCDDYPVTVARRLDAYGHPVTVVSPDPTAADTPARRAARAARDDRIGDLRRAGVRVLDWGADEPFDVALARAEERWSG